MRGGTKKIIIIILVLVAALVLGNIVGISFKQFQQQEEKKTGEGEIGQPAPSSSVSPETGVPINGTALRPAEELLLLPARNASEEEKLAFNTQMGRLTVEADIMEIGERCVLTPLVVRPPEGLPFTFRNTDSVDHEIFVGDKNVLVAAGGEKSIDTKFPNGLGWYGISCGESGNIVGYMELAGSPETAPQ